MTDNLHQFYNDEHTREDVKSYLLSRLDGLALEKVYAKEDTKGLADAKEAIEQAFTELGEKYSVKKEPLVVNSSR